MGSFFLMANKFFDVKVLFGGCVIIIAALSIIISSCDQSKPNLPLESIEEPLFSMVESKQSGIDFYTVIPKFAWMSPKQVVDISLKAVNKKKLVVVPGLRHKLSLLGKYILDGLPSKSFK